MENTIKIIDFAPEHSPLFKALNEEWITTFFELEAADLPLLSHPQEHIIDKGGKIKVGLLNDNPVGFCALIPLDHPTYDFELSKMAVSPKAQGHGIGYLLGKAIVEAARKQNARNIYLVTNSQLIPAIKLYEKLGFAKLDLDTSNYQRGDYHMEYIF